MVVVFVCDCIFDYFGCLGNDLESCFEIWWCVVERVFIRRFRKERDSEMSKGIREKRKKFWDWWFGDGDKVDFWVFNYKTLMNIL